MTNLENVRRFIYRESRLVTAFQVEFIVARSTLRGVCRNVSDAGIRAEFDDPLIVGGSGLLILRPPSGILELQAQVAYIQRRQVGLLFVFANLWERTMTMMFIASIADDTGQAPVILL